MLGGLLLTGAQIGVIVFGAGVVLISLVAMLFLIIYHIIGLVAGESKDSNKE